MAHSRPTPGHSHSASEIVIIVAVADNGVIGRDGQLPWRLSSDLKRFKQLTMGHALLMGRKTYESIGRPLPGRVNIVVSRNPDFVAEGCTVVHTWSDALAAVPDGQIAFAIGGQQIFALALPLAARIYWTQVHARVEGDVRFPDVDWNHWETIREEHYPADANNEFAHTFRELQRV